ncbi:hypothetical protein [Hyphomonas sp. CY54-11-8]|uniref:hypothetical protein n=1 Tax=Hyphomonas sp. CY54-11-8 TaxID=1280944 RepID=UPI000458F4D8|nr:hypothetical protein [Hyphomonas sp. CY54-11-8]KCZ47767.1 hypothetical protein HY17_04630 [Hyphomonas sp. CY54-11-8]
MRPFAKTYSPSDEDTNGLVAAATGATSPVTQAATSAGDGLAHLVTITSAANISALTITITGTDADGGALTEAITGPNATTVTGTKYFLTVTSVAISATLGANTMDVGWADEFTTPTLPLNWRSHQAAGWVTVTGTINYTVQATLDRMGAGITQQDIDWQDLPDDTVDTSDITASVKFVLEPATTAMRLQANSYSSGASLKLSVSQPDI